MSNEVGGDLIGNAWWSGIRDRRPAPGGRRRRRRRLRPPDLRGRLELRDAALRADRRPRRDAGRRHERQAAADRARLPGPHDRARALRLRLGHQVGRRLRGHPLRRRRGLLDRARLVGAGSGQDRLAHRRAPLGCRRRPGRRSTSAAWRGRSTPASPRSRSRSTAARGSASQLAAAPTEDTWVQWARHRRRRRRATTRCGCGRSTRTASCRRARSRRGARRRDRLAHRGLQRPRRVTAASAVDDVRRRRRWR